MSLTKEIYQKTLERLCKAFPELSEDNIANNITMACNFEEAFYLCMLDCERKTE